MAYILNDPTIFRIEVPKHDSDLIEESSNTYLDTYDVYYLNVSSEIYKRDLQ